MKEPCQHHRINLNKGHCDGDEKADRGLEQRQCPTCLRWFFHGEFGRGWAKGLKQGDHINNIFEP